MIKRKKSLTKPSIYIFCNKNKKKRKLINQIGYGIEEEGIPFKVFLKEENSVNKLAYNAAQESRLGIGIGINNDQVLLQMKKLKRNNPVFDKEIKNQSQAKIMGINAARLEKKIPFKKFFVEGD